MTAIYMCKVDKDLLRDKENYTEFVKKLIAEGVECSVWWNHFYLCLSLSLPPSLTAPSHILPPNIPFDRIKIGPAFPNAGGLFLEFPTFDLAVRITSALEKSPSCPKIIMVPTIYVS